jgi:hypothetical protein
MIHEWMNAVTVLVLAGAVCYATLIPYMTRRGDK